MGTPAPDVEVDIPSMIVEDTPDIPSITTQDIATPITLITDVVADTIKSILAPTVPKKYNA